jgi:hypothetical protein
MLLRSIDGDTLENLAVNQPGFCWCIEDQCVAQLCADRGSRCLDTKLTSGC